MPQKFAAGKTLLDRGLGTGKYQNTMRRMIDRRVEGVAVMVFDTERLLEDLKAAQSIRSRPT
jgi:hypothetical protein